MVGKGQLLCHTGSIGIDIQLRQSFLQGLMGYRDTSSVLECCDCSGRHETVYQNQHPQKSWLG